MSHFKHPATYPPPLYVRALTRPLPDAPRAIVKVTAGAFRGAVGEIAAAALVREDEYALLVNVAYRGDVYRIAVDECDLELVERKGKRA